MLAWVVVSRSPAYTRKLGIRLGRLLQGGEIVGLIGELGTGKTCLVRGLTEGLDVSYKAWIRSPTFTLVNEYHGRLPIYHIDLYRVASADELDDVNLREYLYSDGVSVIEWFDYFPAAEVDEHLEIRLAHGAGNLRKLTFVPHGARYVKLIELLRPQIESVQERN